MMNLLERSNGIDLIERGEYGDPFLSYSVEIFNPDNENDTTYEISFGSYEKAKIMFKQLSNLPIHPKI